VGVQISTAIFEIFSYMQMFVLGPRLILSVRAYHAELVVDSDEGAGMTSIAFQEHIHLSRHRSA
jgi:hypothetical protein